MDIDSNVLSMVIQLPHNKQNQYNHKKRERERERETGTVPFYLKLSLSSAMSEFCISKSKIWKG
jgi:hypothetical protein